MRFLFFLVFEHESSGDCYMCISLKHSSSCAELKSYMRQICCFFHILTFWPNFFFFSFFDVVVVVWLDRKCHRGKDECVFET